MAVLINRGFKEKFLGLAPLLLLYFLSVTETDTKFTNHFEILSFSDNDLGGKKEVSAKISWSNVFGTLKFESGVHRVQRIPTTETQGRIHTSAATVAILPMAEEVDIEINSNDLRIDTYRAQGAGGQHVNKTDSAVRITHLP